MNHIFCRAQLRPWLLLLASALLLTVAAQAQEFANYRLAVVDGTPLDQVDVSGRDLGYLENSLRREAANEVGQLLTVVTEENTLSLLEDSGLDPRECSEATCALDLARTLAANWLLSSNLFLFSEEGEYRLQLNLFATGDGRFLASEEVRGQVFMEIVDKARPAAVRLFRLVASELTGVTQGLSQAEVALTLPASETVFVVVDKRPMGWMSVPATGALKLVLSPGSHELLLAREGYRDWTQSLNLVPGHNPELNPQFQSGQSQVTQADSGKGMLVIDSQPGNARVLLDGVERGVTTCNVDGISAGMHQLEVTLPLYLPFRQAVEVSADDVQRVTAVLEEDFAPLRITSEPTGAEVILDGQPRGTTPLQLTQFASGAHRVSLRAPLYHDLQQEFRVTAGEAQTLTLRLEPAFGTLSVMCPVEGAQVYVDGESWGKAPVTRTRIPSGTHTVRVTQELYNDYQASTQVRDAETTTVRADLSADFGTLKVRSTPAGASVRQGSRLLGTTPCELKLAPGSYAISIELQDHVSHSETVHLAIGDERQLAPTLVRMTGSLRVISEPLDAEVFLDGRRLGRAPLQENDLPTGDYELSVRMDDYASFTRRVTIEHGRRSDISAVLSREAYVAWQHEHHQALLHSALLPGWGQLEHKQWRGLIYMAGVLGGGYLAYQSMNDHSAARDDYDLASDDYHSAVTQADIDEAYGRMRSAHQEMEDQDSLNQLALITVGGCYLLAVLDAHFWGGGPRPETGRQLSLGTTPSGDGLALTCSLPFGK